MPDGTDPTPRPPERSPAPPPADLASDPGIERSSVRALFISLALAGTKLVAGVLGNSSALVADAVESFADCVGSLVVIRGLRTASRPPDAAHPYGYGRAEALAAVAVSGLLVAAAVTIIYRAFIDLLTPHKAPAAWTLLVLLAVIAVKEGLYRSLARHAERHRSDAVRADAWHHRADAITTLAAFVGVSIAVWGPGLTSIASLVLADEAAALIASGIILVTAWSLARAPLRELLDASSPEVADAARLAAESVAGVVWCEKAFARKSGRGHLVDMHLHVDPEISVREGHAIAGRAKAEILHRVPSVAYVLIHVEPASRPGTDDPSSAHDAPLSP
ncbi:MAG: cation diffusion facilitator family transporter [Phycisphaerales bacterium]|jgi:cation diffusion facilitator family transporter|nr:cation diffusion facilitator family transporter [Phycisphaerales bacterium]